MPSVKKQRPQKPTFLRAWRDLRGMSQEAAAAKIGRDRTTLSKIERGKVPYDQAILEAAAKAYGCKPVDLLRDPNDPAYEILDAIRALPPEQQAQAKSIIATFRPVAA